MFEIVLAGLGVSMLAVTLWDEADRLQPAGRWLARALVLLAWGMLGAVFVYLATHQELLNG